MEQGYTLEPGRWGTDTLTAPYALLVEAFGDDGDNMRDTDKSQAQWKDVAEGWEVYDYLDPRQLAEITEWHVQASEQGEMLLRGRLTAAVARLHVRETMEPTPDPAAPALRPGEGLEWTDADETKLDTLVASVQATRELLREGHSVNVGERDDQGFFVLGGVSITMSHGVRVAVGLDERFDEEISAPMSEVEARELHHALGVYLAMLDERKS